MYVGFWNANPLAPTTGRLEILNGGYLVSGYSRIGYANGSHGSTLISGAGSTWEVDYTGSSGPGGSSFDAGSLYVGGVYGGSAELTVANGGTIRLVQRHQGNQPGLEQGIYVGLSPQLTLPSPQPNAILNGNGGNLAGNVFVGNGGTISPGVPNATDPNLTPAIGNINITEGYSLSIISGQVELDIATPSTGDSITFSNASGAAGTVSFENSGGGNVTLFLRLSDDVLAAEYFSVPVLIDPGNISGFLLAEGKITIESATSGWGFSTTIDNTGTGWIQGWVLGPYVVPEPGTYALFGTALLVSLIAVRRARYPKH
ncbi:MAG: PEP-CTERM sorting domain-containing protein [Puniceicoccales bacterium]|jgi:hypothetical protein|nr:PEP-CTERM sorting domain-containing protein [Puniceicoccales bacterium]